MNKLFAVLSLTLVICASYAQIYKWVDRQGNVHYSDTPHQGAEVINIPEMQSDTKQIPVTTPSSSEEREQQNTIKLKRQYNVTIIQPENGATIRNNQGHVKVIAQVEPNLISDDKLQILYDGTLLGEPQKTLEFEVNDMYRGSHTLEVQIVDNEGNVINNSDPITIYVFRPRVGMVPGTRP